VNDAIKEAKTTGRRMTVFGIITIILGLFAMAAPAITGLSIAMIVGVLVIIGGILRMVWAFSAGSFGKGLLVFAVGCLTLLCGLALVTNPLFASGFLTAFLAVSLFADGVAELVGAFRVDRGSGRLWLIIGGIASIALAVMIWRQFPISGSWAIGILFGVKLLFVGMAMIAGGGTVRTIAKAASA
jgi:uncharacterized membrane protein HdeD (DUF308 family)